MLKLHFSDNRNRNRSQKCLTLRQSQQQNIQQSKNVPSNKTYCRYKSSQNCQTTQNQDEVKFGSVIKIKANKNKRVLIRTEHQQNQINLRQITSKISSVPLTKRNLKSRRMIVNEGKFAQYQQIHHNLMIEYKFLLKFYETNESKLIKIISRQLSNTKRYQNPHELLNMILSPDFQEFKLLNIDIFNKEVQNVVNFMRNFNIRKKFNQVDIIKESILSRERLIREFSDYNEYEKIYQFMRDPIRYKNSVFDEYKMIRSKFNLPNKLADGEQQLHTKMIEAEIHVSDFMKQKVKEMKKQNKKVFGLNTSRKYRL